MLLNAPEERELIRHLSALTDEIINAAKDYDPARITRYAVTLATLFHKFYNACRVGVEMCIRDRFNSVLFIKRQPENRGKMPGNSLSLSVGVGCEQNLICICGFFL